MIAKEFKSLLEKLCSHYHERRVIDKATDSFPDLWKSLSKKKRN